MSKTISGLPLAETLTGDELLPVVQDGNTVQSTIQQVADLVGNTTTWGDIQGTLSNQTDLQNALNLKVPYTGATGNVNLGEYGLTSGYFQADLTPSGASAVGRMVWNPDFRTTDLGLGGGNVVLHIGQKQVILVVNKTGATLTGSDYQVVKISGAQGQRPKVALAQANNDANSADTIGIVNETITNNQEGFVCTTGTITNINTTGSMQGETWADGDVLYLSGTTAGRLTNIKPQAPIHTVIVGFVIYAHNNQGKIYVKVDNGYELNELHNVRINGVTDGQVLAYDSTLSVWENINQSAITSGNSDKVDGYHVQVDGTGTDPNTIYFKTTGGVDPSAAVWGDITGSIVDQTDLYNALVNGTYATGNWNINAASVDGYSVQVDGTGTDPNTIYFKTTGGTISVDWDDVANTPTTVSGYGITDAVTTSGNQTIGGTKTFSSTITGSITGNADTVDGYNVQVDGTGTDPNTIYFKTTGGSISVEWDDVSNTPTTVSGYGITDAVTTSGNQTVGGTKTFSSTITGSITGNAGTVTNGVYTTGNQTIGGTKTFSSTISGSVSGNAGTATTLQATPTINNVTFAGNANITVPRVRALDDRILAPADGSANYVTAYFTSWANDNTSPYADALLFRTWADGSGGNDNLVTFRKNALGMRIWQQTSGSATAFSSFKDVAWTDGTNATGTWTISTSGNAGTVTNGVYTTGNQTIGGVKTFSNDIGSTFGGQLVLTNSASGATNPNKHFRVGPTGNLEIINSAYNAVPFTFTDAGILSVSAECNAPVFKDVNNSAYYLDPANTGTSMVVAGNVGIGTTSPSSKLEASGADCVVKSSATSGYAGFYAIGSGTNNSYLFLGNTTSGEQGRITSENGGGLVFSNGSGATERIRITSAGNVGIGNNNPTFKLDVNGSFRVANDGGGGVGGLWTMRNTASGATNPDKNFRVGATGSLEIINNAYNSIPFTLTDSGTFVAGESAQAPIFYDVNNTAFYVDPNYTSNINSLVMSGLIQGRSCADTNVNTANDTGSISIRGSSTTVASMSFHRTGAYAMNMGLGTDNVFRIGGWSASNNCLQMDGSGNLTMLNNVTAYSDARLKTDVVKIENALDKVQQLNGYTYTRTDTGSKQTGVIAQEVMKVLPEVVMGSEDTHYSVAYGNMVGLLIEAIKEQQGQINELKLTIEQLKGN